ncbi:hypothetical protein BFD28_23525 [Escherichia coli]|nr:hypothetical protein BFD28_23525 [Escherichia coli]
MDSETVHGTVRSGVTRVPEAGPLFWKRQKHGDGLPVLHPGQTGSSLPGKGLNTATGAAGEGCNEKSSLHYTRSQKAERSL